MEDSIIIIALCQTLSEFDGESKALGKFAEAHVYIELGMNQPTKSS